ncbi:MAG: hypothetical protein IKN43_04960, partial [Selenomonadaceae bacterium]|nr:hypothetical protein [Selenomonadaceae bacterium]
WGEAPTKGVRRMSEMTDVLKVIDKLSDLKNHEAHYAEINRYLAMINSVVALRDVAELMAADIAEAKGKTKEEVISEYYAKI